MHFSVPGALRLSAADRARPSAGHELDDVFPGVRGPLSGAEFVLQNRQDRPVKFLRLRHAHAVDLEPDDVEAGARKNFDHAAGPLIRELEIVRLDQDERFFDFRVLRKLDHVIENSAVAVGKFRPELQIALDRFGIERGQRGRLEVNRPCRHRP